MGKKTLKAVKEIYKGIVNDELLIASFLSSLFIGIAHPTVNKICMENISTRLISLSSIIICLAGVIVPALWANNGKKLYKYYTILSLSEIIVYAIVVTLLVIDIVDVAIYYMVDTIAFSVITKNIMCGSNMLRNKRYNNQDERNRYDNLLQIACNSSSIIGYGINLIYPCGDTVAFILMVIGIGFDNLFSIKAWKRTI